VCGVEPLRLCVGSRHVCTILVGTRQVGAAEACVWMQSCFQVGDSWPGFFGFGSLVFAGATIGGGPNWSLTRAVGSKRMMQVAKGKEEAEVRGDARELRRPGGAAMLEEALCCHVGKHVDVLFELDDGTKLIGGHKVVMRAASKEFEAMFRSGMKEEEKGVVRMRGVCASAVKGLLEWVYLGEWMGVMMTLQWVL
jgi:hypothetical protein